MAYRPLSDKVRVDVLTVSKRTGWEVDAINTLEQQTFNFFRWIIVTEGRNEFLENYFKVVDPCNKRHLLLTAPPKKYLSNLNASLNHGLRHVQSDLVIFYQDFIDLQPHTFEWLLADAHDKHSFVSTCTINPDGHTDVRYTGLDILRECTPGQWEANVAVAPMRAIRKLGGFDEEYDRGWSWDNVNLSYRAAMLGNYQFKLDEAIRPQLLFHPKEPDLHPEIPTNGERHENTMREIVEGKRPLKCNYL